MAPRRKHVPQRTCVVCGTIKPKRELTRIVRTPDKGVQIDTTGKMSGRGAYICSQATCWGEAVKSNVLERALQVALSDDEKQRLLDWTRALQTP